MAKVGICEAHWSPLPTILAILEMILCARGKPPCACVVLSLADANGLKYGVQRLRAEFLPCHASSMFTVLLAYRMPKVQMTWRTCNKVFFVLRKGCNIIVTLCEASRLVADDSVVFRFCSVGWTTNEMVLDRAQAVHPGFAILAIVVGWTQVSLPRACYMCVCSDVTDLIFLCMAMLCKSAE